MTEFTLTRANFLAGLAASAALALTGEAWADDQFSQQAHQDLKASSWQLGPFSRAGGGPVIRPNAQPMFIGPIRKRPVHWMAAHTFNPASIVRDGKMVVLFRAEDQPDVKIVGGHTSRLGYAYSDDGEHFSYRPAPVLYPDEDAQKAAEWRGGCEDPRLCEGPDGTYYVTYTQWNREKTRLGLASSRDLIHWRKHGSAFTGTSYENLATKSAAIIQKIEDGRMKAARIDGKYWMVFGEGQIHIATSTDLIHWSPIQLPNGELFVLLAPRRSRFDSGLAEVGPPPLVTEKGIVMLYNGKNSQIDTDRDPKIGAGAYSGGQALLDLTDPAKVLDRANKPFIQPELSWEKTGQYAAGTTFIEGLSYFRSKLYLYYGTADNYVGLAVAAAPSWLETGAKIGTRNYHATAAAR
ncbi:pesticidal protein Cry15Aa [Sphingomonas koreensis]|nr:pesticidal protein Cry15Aa [Sphingomonas koreensis]